MTPVCEICGGEGASWFSSSYRCPKCKELPHFWWEVPPQIMSSLLDKIHRDKQFAWVSPQHIGAIQYYGTWQPNGYHAWWVLLVNGQKTILWLGERETRIWISALYQNSKPLAEVRGEGKEPRMGEGGRALI
jgi:hypothetical protein